MNIKFNGTNYFFKRDGDFGYINPLTGEIIDTSDCMLMELKHIKLLNSLKEVLANG